MTIPLARSRWQPSTWMPWLFGPQSDRGAVITCPNGHAFSIGGGRVFGSVHSIDNGGAVSPSVVCPHCSFHVFARLDGWSQSLAALLAVIVLAIAAPAGAEPTPLKWPAANRPIADSISNWVVAANIGADTIKSWRSADRRDAFTCQAIRIGATLGAAELAKRVIHRRRPDGSDDKSFYSMHTALAMQASGWRVQAGIPIAIGAGYFRMAADRHYLTDVAVGAAAGLLASQFFGGTECVP